MWMHILSGTYWKEEVIKNKNDILILLSSLFFFTLPPNANNVLRFHNLQPDGGRDILKPKRLETLRPHKGLLLTMDCFGSLLYFYLAAILTPLIPKRLLFYC